MRTVLCRDPLGFVIGQKTIEGRLDVDYYKPEYREVVGVLKNSPFELKRLGNIVSLSSERWKRPKSGTFRYIEINDVDIFSGKIAQAKELNVKDAPSRAQMMLRKDDIIVSTTRPYRGAIAPVTKEYDGAVCSTGFAVIRKLKIKINRKYLLHFLRSVLGLKQMEQRMTGGNYPAIGADELLKIWVAVPPIPVQSEIVEIIDTALKEKRKMEKDAQNLLGSIDDYLRQELGIRIPRVEQKTPLVYEIGAKSVMKERWDTEYWKPEYRGAEKAIHAGKYKIEKLGQFIKEISYGASVKSVYSEHGVPLLRIVNLKPNEMDLRDIVRLPDEAKKQIGNSYVEEGDFLISRSGTIGIVAIVPKEADGFAFGSYMIRFKVGDNKIDEFYLSVILTSIIGRVQTQRNKIGAIQTNITIPSIKNLRIPVPPKAIQLEIANEVKAKIEKAKELEKTGKQKVQDAKEKIERIILGEAKYE
jgi:type I restriction enzyme S subunit